jgi:Cu+-exporting ATPase
MHPEIVGVLQGLPICGMALEPRAAILNDGPNPELLDMTRRLWIAVLLARPSLF